MPLTISDEVLREAGLTEHELAVEIACRLFAGQILSQAQAGRLCGLTRNQFEGECHRRGIPLHIYTREMLEQDVAFAQSTEASHVRGQ